MLSTPLRFLPLLPQELRLATVLRSGQSFRWQQLPAHCSLPHPQSSTSSPPASQSEWDGEWALGWADRTIVLRQTTHGLHYRALYNFAPPHSNFIKDIESDTTLPILINYFQLSTPLAPLYRQWMESDAHFARKLIQRGKELEGIRVLNQPPWETLIAFIISSNNNIGRIGGIVNAICSSLGERLPHPRNFTHDSVHTTPATIPATSPPAPKAEDGTEDLAMYAMPPPSAFAAHASLDAHLRKIGAGYRAPYIAATAEMIIKLAQEKGCAPEEWLEGLREGVYAGSMEEAREELKAFVGVGPKVADCVALFSLGWHSLVPIDTHVFQIAVRDYAFPAARNTAVTPQLNARVADKLRSIWGPYAGWCQQVLFFADLKNPTNSPSPKKRSTMKAEVKSEDDEGGADVKRKLTFEEEVEQLINSPGVKRRRSVAGSVKVEDGSVEVKKENESPTKAARGRSPVKADAAEGESALAKKVKKEI